MKIEVTNRVPDFDKALKKLLTQQVAVGVTEETAPRDDGADRNNAEIGYMTEFGEPENNIPQRAVLQPGVASVKQDIGYCLAQAAKAILSGKPYEEWLDYAGKIGKEGVQDFINAGNFAPLSPLTIAMRKARGNSSEAPLIDTERFINSITFTKPK